MSLAALSRLYLVAAGGDEVARRLTTPAGADCGGRDAWNNVQKCNSEKSATAAFRQVLASGRYALAGPGGLELGGVALKPGADLSGLDLTGLRAAGVSAPSADVRGATLTCDGCSAALKAGSQAWSCAALDHDLCLACSKTAASDGAAALPALHQHCGCTGCTGAAPALPAPGGTQNARCWTATWSLTADYHARAFAISRSRC